MNKIDDLKEEVLDWNKLNEILIVLNVWMWTQRSITNDSVKSCSQDFWDPEGGRKWKCKSWFQEDY